MGRHGDIRHNCADLTKISKVLNFTPEYDLTGWGEGTNYILGKGEERLGFGLRYKINNNFGIIGEYHSLESFDSYDFLNIFEDDFPNTVSNHLGCYYNSKNSKEGLLNQLNFRFGLYSKKYKFLDNSFYDNGMTFGLGLEYSNYENAIDVCFLFGSRESEYLYMGDEDYFKFILSITSGEKWFQNRRD